MRYVKQGGAFAPLDALTGASVVTSPASATDPATLYLVAPKGTPGSLGLVTVDGAEVTQIRARGQQVIAGSTYDAEVLADSPLVYLRGASPNLPAAVDLGGSNRHFTSGSLVTTGGTAIGSGSVPSWSFPGSGSASANALSIADAAWQSPHAGGSGAMTWECRFNVSSLAAIRTLWGKVASSNFEFLVSITTAGAIQAGCFVLSTAADAGTATSANGVVTTGTNYHLACTWDRAGNSVKVYLNGTQVASAATSADTGNGTAPLVFGYRASADDRQFVGRASHLALYGTALNATRIAAHAAAA